MVQAALKPSDRRRASPRTTPPASAPRHRAASGCKLRLPSGAQVYIDGAQLADEAWKLADSAARRRAARDPRDQAAARGGQAARSRSSPAKRWRATSSSCPRFGKIKVVDRARGAEVYVNGKKHRRDARHRRRRSIPASRRA